MMGSCQSQLCTVTLSQSVVEPHGKAAVDRQVPADPTKAQEAAAYKASAVAAAQRMLAANKGANWRDTYVRATLVSYGASCRVFTATNKHTDQQVAIKLITKVDCLCYASVTTQSSHLLLPSAITALLLSTSKLGLVPAVVLLQPVSVASCTMGKRLVILSGMQCVFTSCLLPACCNWPVRLSQLPCRHTVPAYLTTLFLQSLKNAELQQSRVLQEMGAMLRVQHHPHAVKLLDAYEDGKSYQLVMPMLKGQHTCTAMTALSLLVLALLLSSAT